MKQTITEQFDANAAELLAQHNLMNAVYAVLTIIFVGILLYLFRLDRKISKIEKTHETLSPHSIDIGRYRYCNRY